MIDFADPKIDNRPVRRKRKGGSFSALEETFAWQCKAAGFPEPVRQHRFCPGRLFRADFAWPEYKLIVECEGGIFARKMKDGQDYGWHQSIGRMRSDMEKYNLAALAGWRVLRYSGAEIKSGKAVNEVEQALKSNSRSI